MINSLPWKTRIAPTPSGYLHLGNALSFLLTQKYTGHLDASVRLRIDDMDAARVREDFVADIFESLEFLQVNINEGPRSTSEQFGKFSQRRRLDRYRGAIAHLHAAGVLYACICSRTEFARGECKCRESRFVADDPEAVWRFRTEDRDTVLLRSFEGTRVVQLPNEIRNFVVRKKGGDPAYQLCSVVDDIDFGINLIVRGEDLFASTLAQLALAAYLPENNFAETFFVHHPLLTDANGNKLSKSAGSLSLRALRAEGRSLSAVKSMLPALKIILP